MANIFIGIVGINTIAAMITIFRERRDVASIWAWLIVLCLLPGFGFLLYLFVGKKISKENIFDLRNQEKLGLTVSTREQKQLLAEAKEKESYHYSQLELMSLFADMDDTLYTRGDRVELLYNGYDKFEQLLRDIQSATHHIHLQYYIFKPDMLGKKIMQALCDKAKEGVEVLVLYDALGSRTLHPNFFRRLKKLGGKAAPFFGSAVPFVNLRMNYRNHRKIAIIDGCIGYVGGFNIGDEYLGKSKLGYWRDTHLRITGEAVHSLQTRFFVDWNAAVKTEDERGYQDAYFPNVSVSGTTEMHIVASGPESDLDQIKLGYIKMITLAKKNIYLQTPYFIPDESVLDALKIAIRSGVQVHIMIPNKPDHIFVYRATEYYARMLQEIGANVYIYDKGFLHAKVLSIDSRIACVGTANFDIRSFALNFEVSAFLYDADLAKKIEEQFLVDVSDSIVASDLYFKQQSRWKKFKQAFSRLFSPIL